jgi:D-tagatose-1,6-bisphosphate aldolase subunit GatZ/KbaZ
LPYQADIARLLSKFIESQPMIFEAHSTDYQTRAALKNLVRDHFAILKVGPGLTFAFREAVFALARIEDELLSEAERSHIVQVLDEVMVKHPESWKKYYQGDEQQQAFKRKFSFSDRIRYYWSNPDMQAAFERLLRNLEGKPLPLSLLSQYLPRQYERVRSREIQNHPHSLLLGQVMDVLEDYVFACEDNGKGTF